MRQALLPCLCFAVASLSAQTYAYLPATATPTGELSSYSLVPFMQPNARVQLFYDAAEVVGTVRPDSLSSTNQTTFISLYLPDLFLAASMVFVSGYQRDFALGASQPNDPGMPINYESQYQTLLKSAGVEEARKKFEAAGWTSMSPEIGRAHV